MLGEPRYFFDKDDDGHWYMIPTNLSQWWNDLNEDSRDPDEDKAMMACEQINEVFGEFMVGGFINEITFTDPREW